MCQDILRTKYQQDLLTVQRRDVLKEKANNQLLPLCQVTLQKNARELYVQKIKLKTSITRNCQYLPVPGHPNVHHSTSGVMLLLGEEAQYMRGGSVSQALVSIVRKDSGC